VIEAAAKQPFEKVVRATLLEPAGMISSGVLGMGKPPKLLAQGYTSDKMDWDQVLGGATLTDGHLKPVARLALTPPVGDAWLYSTVDDLYRWSEAMEGSVAAPPSLVEKAWTAGLGGYGAGWFVGDAFGTRRVRHNGFLPGFVTDFVKFPAAKVTIVIVSNMDSARLSNFMRDLSFIVFGKPCDMPVHGPTVKVPTPELVQLEGEYRMKDSTVVVVKNDPEYLTASIKGRFTAGLIPLSPSEFYMPLADGRATFVRGPDGRGARVNLRYSGEDHVAERAVGK
jgi:CubicO group peptidase (beta-lactamase class C family)